MGAVPSPVVGGALDGIRILDLSWGIAGPIGVLLLAEHGADVVKVEPPGGDPFRSYEGYRCWNRSRRSVVLDLKDSADRDAFLRLVATADAVVESFRPDVLDRLGVGWSALREVNPAVVLVSCPPYPAGHRLSIRLVNATQSLTHTFSVTQLACETWSRFSMPLKDMFGDSTRRFKEGDRIASITIFIEPRPKAAFFVDNFEITEKKR